MACFDARSVSYPRPSQSLICTVIVTRAHLRHSFLLQVALKAPSHYGSEASSTRVSSNNLPSAGTSQQQQGGGGLAAQAGVGGGYGGGAGSPPAVASAMLLGGSGLPTVGGGGAFQQLFGRNSASLTAVMAAKGGGLVG